MMHFTSIITAFLSLACNRIVQKCCVEFPAVVTLSAKCKCSAIDAAPFNSTVDPYSLQCTQQSYKDTIVVFLHTSEPCLEFGSSSLYCMLVTLSFCHHNTRSVPAVTSSNEYNAEACDCIPSQFCSRMSFDADGVKGRTLFINQDNSNSQLVSTSGAFRAGHFLCSS